MKKKDIILIAAILLVAGIFWLVLQQSRSVTGNTVRVTVDGEVFGEYSLDEDQVITIETDLGTNVLEISDGSAVMIEASCPDGYCMDQGHISHNTETIVCLPNKVVAEVLLGEDSTEEEIDGISQ